MALKYIRGIDNHDQLSKFTFYKYEKRSPLGQIQILHNIQPVRPLLAVQLPSNYDLLGSFKSQPQKQNKQNSTSRSAEYDLSQYRPAYPRNKSAPVWIRVPNHNRMAELCSLSEPSSCRRAVVSGYRKSTAQPTNSTSSRSAKTSATTQQGCKKATSAVVGKPPTIYKLNSVNQQIQLSRESIQLCTSLIKEQWDSENRQYIKTGVYARGKIKDEDLLQWFTFEGDSPGTLQAFTNESDKMTQPARYSIEASVGKEVAGKLLPGGAVRIGKNGQLLHGEETSTDKHDFYVRCDQILEMTRKGLNIHEPLYPPLTMNDVEKEARIITCKPQTKKNTHLGKENSNGINLTRTVVYNETPKLKPYVTPDDRTNEDHLVKLLAHKTTTENKTTTVQKPGDGEITYEEILKSRAPLSSRAGRNSAAMPSPVSKYPETSPAARPETTPIVKLKAPSCLVSQDSKEARLKTPRIPEDVKCGIQRQCTMPMYKTAVTTTVNGQRVAVTGNTKEASRIATPIRPPKYIPAYNCNNKNKTTPSILPNGLEGQKTFIKFHNTLPADDSYLDYAYDDQVPQNGEDYCDPILQQPVFPASNTPPPSQLDDNKPTNPIPVVSQKPPPSPAVKHLDRNQNQMALVGKAPPVETVVRSSTVVKTPQVSLSRGSSTPTRSHPLPPQPTANEQTELVQSGPSRLAVNIPVADMVSASSAAVNSIADFQEFGMDGRDTDGVVTDQESSAEPAV